jgi:MFS family permease
MTIFIVSITAAGFSINISFLIASRIIQGVGLSMFIIALSILQSEAPKEKYALANGILASLYFSGSSIGLILGGSIVHYFDWRLTFFSLLPFLGILYFVVVKFLKIEKEEEEEENQTTESKKLESSHSNSIDNNNNEKIKIKKENNRLYSYLPNKDKIDIKGYKRSLSSSLNHYVFPYCSIVFRDRRERYNY